MVAIGYEGKIDTQTREDPGASFITDGGGRNYLRGLRKNTTEFWGENWRRRERAHACGPCTRCEGTGLRQMEAV